MAKHLIGGIVLGGLLIGVGIAGSRPAEQAPKTADSDVFVIRNVRVFDGEKSIASTDVVVRNGLIASVGVKAPAGTHTIDGTGRTLMPGLIDAHTHAFGNALERALVFGVTTELDMFTDHGMAATLRKEQQEPGGASKRADLFSAGTLVTAPGGHGTEYGLKIPTLTSAADAPAFVKARIAEGSDYIKIVYDIGMRMPSIDLDTLRATVAAAKNANKLAVVHISTRRSADDAIGAGASGLIHMFADALTDEGFVGRVVEAGAFVTPTLSVIESVTGVASGTTLIEDPHLQPFLLPEERTSLSSSFPKRANSPLKLENALAGSKLLFAAGVPILAGTDAPNPGTSHGVSIHRELELLVRAGLSAEAALAAATSVPARIFSLRDRGRIAPGMRADLLLVSGDPTHDITTTRNIVSIWKRGVTVQRSRAGSTTTTDRPSPTTTGIISSFDQGEVRAEFGSGWQISTDSFMGGKSEATMKVVDGGAKSTRGALEVTGTVAAGTPYPWAGAMFFPDAVPMNAVNLSGFKEIVFWARGDGGEHQLMVFATRLGSIPATHPFTPGAEWREFVVPLASLGLDGSDIKGVLFSAGAKPGAFRFTVDEIRFR